MATLTAPIATFRTGYAASRFAICLSGAMDAFDPNEPYSRIYIFNERAGNRWTFNQHDHVVSSICTWRDPATPQTRYFVGLFEDGEIVIQNPTLTRERILGAGLHNDAAAGHGYLNQIRQIGTRLYACGVGGQVYRRDSAQVWTHMDQGLLQPVGTQGGLYLIQTIGGPNEGAIYVAGCENRPSYPPRADYWNGQQWQRLNLPATAGRITNIHVESEKRVWLCGANGTLLRGNAVDGFQAVNPLGDKKLLLSVTIFREVVYLGTNLGLYQFDAGRPGSAFRRVRTGLDPELTDANIAQAVDDDVLWSIGPKDIARFDGQAWERIRHPDNPPIGRP